MAFPAITFAIDGDVCFVKIDSNYSPFFTGLITEHDPLSGSRRRESIPTEAYIFEEALHLVYGIGAYQCLPTDITDLCRNANQYENRARATESI